MNRTPDPVTLAKELETIIDLNTVTKEEVEQRVAYKLVKHAGTDKLIAMYLSVSKPSCFEVKTFQGNGTFLETEDIQAAIDAYNEEGLDIVTREEIENQVAYGVVALCGADKIFLTVLSINKPPHYVVRNYGGEKIFSDTEDMQAAIDAYNQVEPSGA